MVTLPTTLTAAGLQPTPPAVWLAGLLALVAAVRPGYTALPGSLIEDISSTDVGAITQMDQMRIDLINSLSPFGANEFLLNQLGAGVYGIIPNLSTNTSVFVVFSGTPGFVMSVGFTVTDGTHQYVVQDGGIVGSGGISSPMFCIANQTGEWAVPANSVTGLITSVPSTITLSVDNPETGTPGSAAETEEAYRSRVLMAGLVASQGMARMLKTLLAKVTGVQARLISVVQEPTGGWSILCGGGDPNEVAYAIFIALFDISTLVGSINEVLDVTPANPGVVHTSLDHGFVNGQSATISDSVVTSYNGTFVVTVVDSTHFSIGIDTSAYAPYTGGGIVTPNNRNITVSIYDYPDTYLVTYVNPPQQDVAIAVTWNTNATNFISPVAISAAAIPEIVAYINGIAVGQPINVLELQSVFSAAVADILPPQLLTRLLFAVSINGVGVLPTAGTSIIPGDPQSFFLTDSSQIVVSQG